MFSEAALLLIPLGITLIYGESAIWAFIIPAAALAVCGFALGFRAPRNSEIYARDGLVTVAVSWVVLSIFGALPLVVSGAIPNFVDALFETVSGFTTTGASILREIESLEHGVLFWRSFTHWIGGMGVLVFVLAILPASGGRNMHIMRAEVPGPEVGKLVSKLGKTAKILYGIYLALTLTEVLLLFCGGMPLYDSFVHSFGTAGTGGFSIKNASIGAYGSVYYEMVISVFMILFGVNFNLYYFLLLRNFRDVFRSEELRLYLGIITVSTVTVALNIMKMYHGFGNGLRYAFFQVSSIMTTTGFSSTDFNQWPNLSKAILVMLMIVGASAGSTGGGLKISRLLILFKSAIWEIKRFVHPHAVVTLRMDKKKVDDKVVRGTYIYFVFYMLVTIVSILLVSIDPASNDLVTSSTAVIACFNNIGPGLGDIVGPTGNYAALSIPTKLLLTLDMLLGRLEIFPIIMLFAPSMWKMNRTRVKRRRHINTAD